MSSALSNGRRQSSSLKQIMTSHQLEGSIAAPNGNPTLEQAKQISFCRDIAHNASLLDEESSRVRCYSPIAIIGMAARLPGGIMSTDEFWEFLVEGKDGLCDVPESRYKFESFYNETTPRSVKAQKGYFLQHDPAYFDPGFFDITPFEAERMDPQQRQLLEVVWECLESAGERNWRGKEIGCFVGVYGEDWLEMASKDSQGIERYHVLGTGQFALSNRVSYEYDFQGPSMTIQTGCSSSLVGLHEACQAIHSGECSSAIVAGTNLILTPTMTTTMSDNMVLSPSGACRTFDEKADGYGRGEAVNAIYIKSLDDAIRDNDPIRAVIRGTSTNCDGNTPSITTPGSRSQERLIRNAYRKAKIDNIQHTGFFECHGTGTIVGDTAETSVVARIFQDNGVIIGAVKPNVGHSEGASGITSVIKAVLSLENRTIPPNIFFESPNPKIPFKEAKLKVPTTAMQWPESRLERASVNCFGIGGANAHVVLDSTASYYGNDFCHESLGKQIPSSKPRLLVVSAKAPEALQERIQKMTDYVNNDLPRLADVAFTLGERREHMQYRAFAVASANKPVDASLFHTGQAKAHPELSFIFTGQGAQWPGMGKDLIDKYEVFRKEIEDLDNTLQSLVEPPMWSLKGTSPDIRSTGVIDPSLSTEELAKSGGTSRVDNAELSQPLCTALQIGLVNLLRHMGVQPSCTVGHSSGEIAAAYAAGALSAKSAMALAYYRGKVTATQEGKGAMLAVGVSRDKISPYLKDGVVLACENSPESVTLSGDIEVIRDLTLRIKRDFPDTLCRPLRVKTAYHSHHMQGLGKSYESYISSYLEHNDNMLPMFSSVVVSRIDEPKLLGAKYWKENLQRPVLFSQAIGAILAQDHPNHHFLEIGPHCALAGPLRQIFQSAAPKRLPTYTPTLTRFVGDSQSQILHTLGSVHATGIKIDFAAANGCGKTLTNLPSYPWQHKKYWNESRLTSEWRHRQFPHHELLGARTAESCALEPSWRNLLRVEDVPWIWDHVLQSNIVFPGAGYIAMAGEAIRQLLPDVDDYSVRNVVFKAPLMLKADQVVEMLTTLGPVSLTDLVDSEWYKFTIMANEGGNWIKHCQGQVRSQYDFPPAVQSAKSYIRNVDSEHWYQALACMGLSYGKAFQGLDKITAHPVNMEAQATVSSNNSHCSARYTLHPTNIDQCLQLMSVAMTNGISRHIDRIAIPAAIGSVYVAGTKPEMTLGADMVRNSTGTLVGNSVASVDDRVLLSLSQASFFTVPVPLSSDCNAPLHSEIKWVPDVNLTCLASWLPPPHISGEAYESSKAGGIMVLLFILETAHRLAPITPAESHMRRFKAWLDKETSKIASGYYTSIPESKNWAPMSSDERECIVLDIESRHQDGVATSWISCARKVLNNCVALAKGTRSGVEILLEGDSLDKLYETSTSIGSWKEAMQLLGANNPTMKILEIGAGTGGATRKVLSDLVSPEGVRLYSKYVFTDISPGFTVSAQEKFANYQNLEFKVLDISRDPAEQGFELHEFDMIVASNVLHATPCLQATLSNVRKLLAPGGRLLLHELNSQNMTIDYLMGVLPGWWIGENDGRVERPYLSPDRWHNELQEAGFTGSEIFAYDIDEPFQRNFTMILGVAAEKTSNNVLLVMNTDPGPWACDLASHLRQQGHQIRWGTLDDDPPSDHDIIFMLDLQGPFLYHADKESFSQFQDFITKVRNQVLWVTHSSQTNCTDARYGVILGLARTLRREMNTDICTFEVDLFDTMTTHLLVQVYHQIKFSRQTQDVDNEYEFLCRSRSVYIPRCHWGSAHEENHIDSLIADKMAFELDIKVQGVLDSLCWKQRPCGDLDHEHIEVELKYIGVNFRDVLTILGVLDDKPHLGLEGSGVVRNVGSDVKDFTPGDRVVIYHPGLFKTKIITEPQRCFKVPEGISLEEAATMPAVYATAIYSLIELASLKKSQGVLIHSACGGVGLASIQICQLIGAEIFATVGSDAKVEYLMKHFGIPRRHIFNSHSKEFLPQVMQQTGGRGVDVVLNSLAGELLHASWECVASRGRMIELGKRDFLTNGTLSMVPFSKNRTFHGVDILILLEESPEMLEYLFSKFFDWLQQGRVKPIQPVNNFPATRIQEAFRYMQQGTHMGKIVVEMPENPAELVSNMTILQPSFSSHVSYLLVGGLGGLGRAVSIWMVENGARSLVYLSRSAGKSIEDQNFIKELQSQGCEAVCVPGDVSQLPDVQKAVASCTKPLAGVLQMSMALNDRSFETMTYDDWTSTLAPKISGTWNLHQAVEQEDLDFFVAFSSLGGLCGNIGQANYAAANTFLDSFSQYRQQLGLPCSALVLGAVQDAGFVSQNRKVLQSMQSSSVRLMTAGEVMKGLWKAICQSKMPSSSPVIVGLGNTRPLSEPGVRTMWARDKRFAMYYNLESDVGTVKEVSDNLKVLLAKVEKNPALLDESETETIVRWELGKLITQHMPNAQDMSDEEVNQIVIDSLMSIEIKGWGRRNLGLEISLAEITKAGTVGRLANVVMEHLRDKYSSEN